MSGPVVAIVHLGRMSAMGQVRRIESLARVFEAAGCTPVPVALVPDHRSRPPVPAAADWFGLARGEVVPEVLSWSLHSLRQRLQRLRPEVLVLATARAYRPALADLAPVVVLDFIDRLSVSYEQRMVIAGSALRRFGYRALAPFHRRFESKPGREGVVAIAAGWTDALALGATWVPITVQPHPVVDDHDADHDVIFLGTLSYPPNVAALERLARMWPSLLARRPGTTAMIAGASPPSTVLALARERGWTVMANFSQLSDVLRRARLAVAPLVDTAGIQTKVLDAAAHGIPQVLTPQAVAGLRPGFPATVAQADYEFVAEMVALLNEKDRRDREARAAQEHVLENYCASEWTAWASHLAFSTRMGSGGIC